MRAVRDFDVEYNHAFSGLQSQKWTLDVLGNWDDLATNPDVSGATWENETRDHNEANEVETRDTDDDGTDDFEITYDEVGNVRDIDRPGDSTEYRLTHDAWNRLAKVQYNPGGGYGNLAEYTYTGTHWRIREHFDSDFSGSLDDWRWFYYNAEWQLLEQRIDGDGDGDDGHDPHVQFVWGVRGLDDVILHRQDNNSDSDYADENVDYTFWHLTDAIFSAVAVLNETAAVVERVSYTAYGRARHHDWRDVDGDGGYDLDDLAIINALATVSGTPISDPDYNVDADFNRDGVIDYTDKSMVPLGSIPALPEGVISNDDVCNILGFAGYIFNDLLNLSGGGGTYLARHRWYDPDLGRWLQRDPAGYVDGMSLYLYALSNPLLFIDPLGLLVPPNVDDSVRQYDTPGGNTWYAGDGWTDIPTRRHGIRERHLHYANGVEKIPYRENDPGDVGEVAIRTKNHDATQTINRAARGTQTVVNTGTKMVGVGLILVPGPDDVVLGAALAGKGIAFVRRAGKWFRRAEDGTDIPVTDRKTLRALRDYEQHHGLPKEHAREFKKRGIRNIDDYVIPVDKGKHRLTPDGLHTKDGGDWNGTWKKWLREHEDATPEDVIDQLNKMIDEFGLGCEKFPYQK